MNSLLSIYNDGSKNSVINDDNFLNAVLNYYKTSDRSHANLRNGSNGKSLSRINSLYDFLTGTSTSRDTTKVNKEDYEKYYIKMTDIWLKNIKSLTKSKLEELKRQGLPGYEILQKALKNIDSVESMRDIDKIYTIMVRNLDIDFEKYNYFWRSKQETSGFFPQSDYVGDFTHVDSRYIHARKIKRDKTEFRIYIDCANEDLFKIISEYTRLCETNRIPYYFKFQTDPKRNDKFLVYCSLKELKANIDILNSIGAKYPSMVSRCGNPPILTNKINKWMGLGEEPDNEHLEFRHSFNTLRADILDDSCEILMINYIKNHLNKTVNHNGKKVFFASLLLENAASVIMDELKTTDPEFKKRILETLKAKSKSGTPNIFNGFKRLEEVLPEKGILYSTNFSPIFKIKLPDEREYDFSIKTADKVLKSMIDVMKENDINYISTLREYIKKTSSIYGVDPNNIALNSNTHEKFKTIESKTIKIDEQFINKLKSIRSKYLSNDTMLRSYYQERKQNNAPNKELNEIAKIILNNKKCYENIDTDIKLIIRTKPLSQIESHMINKYENYVVYTFNLPQQELKHSI